MQLQVMSNFASQVSPCEHFHCMLQVVDFARGSIRPIVVVLKAQFVKELPAKLTPGISRNLPPQDCNG